MKTSAQCSDGYQVPKKYCRRRDDTLVIWEVCLAIAKRLLWGSDPLSGREQKRSSPPNCGCSWQHELISSGSGMVRGRCAAGSVLMRDVVLYIRLTSSALLHHASLEIGTPNSGFVLSLIL